MLNITVVNFLPIRASNLKVDTFIQKKCVAVQNFVGKNLTAFEYAHFLRVGQIIATWGRRIQFFFVLSLNRCTLLIFSFPTFTFRRIISSVVKPKSLGVTLRYLKRQTSKIRSKSEKFSPLRAGTPENKNKNIYCTALPQKTLFEERRLREMQSLDESVTSHENRKKYSLDFKWPNDIADVALRFFCKGGLPSVVGCVDGTHIPIRAPTANEDQFVNCHGDHSLNCMMVAGPNYKFYYVSARWPGFVHDARVLRNSSLFTKFDGDRWRPIPNVVLLGDSGYPLKEWLIPPLLRPRNDAEARFNITHK
uniref:Putative nuclease HARBI1 n=1 Tax=Romanomermis culicivorax TaxID=13658 RepID=A0A915KYU7_ROMCU